VEVEVPAVDELVFAAAAAVSTRLSDVTDDLVELLTHEIPPLRDDPRIESLLSASVAANVATLLHVFEHGIDPQRVEAPAAAVEYARRLAQRGVPLAALVRAYRIGHARFLRWCFEELKHEAADAPVIGEATRRMTELSFVYIDRISERVIEFYEQERDRWLNNRATVRLARVLSVLADEDFDIDATEATLGYRLRRHHLGLVAWMREPTGGGQDLLVLEQAAALLAQRAGCPARPLFVPRDESSAWAWLPLQSERIPDQVLGAAVVDADVCISLGEPGDDVEGFRRSHCQALSAQTVALAAGPRSASVTAFADIRPIALMCSDLDATRAWVLDTLGALAIDDEQHARLRLTLRIFLSTGGSYTATADRLQMHKNTVHYRVNKAEEMRGRSLQEDRLDVELALLACESLGPAVLRSVS
jgi:DNA-binding PucR family transcriptional regulator